MEDLNRPSRNFLPFRGHNFLQDPAKWFKDHKNLIDLDEFFHINPNLKALKRLALKSARKAGIELAEFRENFLFERATDEDNTIRSDL